MLYQNNTFSPHSKQFFFPLVFVLLKWEIKGILIFFLFTKNDLSLSLFLCRIDPEGVVPIVKDLFKEHTDLILGFKCVGPK